jgi:ATP-dependent DNA helicase RecG
MADGLMRSSALPSLDEPMGYAASHWKNADRQALARLDIQTPVELLHHLPVRYQDLRCERAIASLSEGEEALVSGVITHSQRLARGMLFHLRDDTGTLALRFFRMHPALQARCTVGAHAAFFGTVRLFQGQLEMVHPQLPHRQHTAQARCWAIYPTTAGLSQMRLRHLVGQALTALAPDDDPLPEAVRARWDVLGFKEAACLVHQPSDPADKALQQAQERLVLDELLAHALVRRYEQERLQRLEAPALQAQGDLQERLLAGFGFTLTPGQQAAWGILRHALGQRQPMRTLLQGEVGCGKTVVTALALAQAVDSGHQAALMAPTELLAEQHAVVLRRWFEPCGVVVGYLAGSTPAASRRELLTALASGAVPLVVGTHAMAEEAVRFARLGLVVIDEQQRFGIRQRQALAAKGGELQPHQLLSTATPIPRTLALVGYGTWELCVIEGLPAGRQPVKTVLLPTDRLAEVTGRLAQRCAQGEQAYWVCTVIDEHDDLAVQAAQGRWAQLHAALPGIRVGLVHGRMTAAERQEIMMAFQRGTIQVLVATTVIEVGIDVPQATLMVIENPERLGLSQLHQLRGRIGRGSGGGVCVLLADPALSPVARVRLATLRATTDGFRIAEADLAQRGPGEWLGRRQAGFVSWRLADPLHQPALWQKALEMAQWLWEQEPAAARAMIRWWFGEKADWLQA